LVFLEEKHLYVRMHFFFTKNAVNVILTTKISFRIHTELNIGHIIWIPKIRFFQKNPWNTFFRNSKLDLNHQSDKDQNDAIRKFFWTQSKEFSFYKLVCYCRRGHRVPVEFRVARFFLVQHTKTGEKLPNNHKIRQMVTK
jgi:hypothetical protein